MTSIDKGLQKIRVIHLIDTLEPGGAERVAVNIINSLPSEKFERFLCTTRYGGPLLKEKKDDICYLGLNRKSTFDIKALIKLYLFIKEYQIQIIHAHSSSLFISVVMKLLIPSLKVIWHYHSGSIVKYIPLLIIYKKFSKKVDFVITVNQELKEWSIKSLGVAPQKSKFVPNFIVKSSEIAIENFPGFENSRIVCVANFRPVKDHHTLIKAMRIVCNKFPYVHLILLGDNLDQEYTSCILNEINEFNLQSNISWLGSITNVQSYLKYCNIGVLSSKSEGLPLSLLEYGLIGLPVIVTNVGQCAEVVDYGKAGVLVEPEQPESLAQAIILLLENESIRNDLAVKFHEKVINKYSSQAVIPEVIKIYEQVLKQ
ncbi:MAG TPA: glycosyltransferase [Bacteroidetes bacterium]|nr:glycosyltransferase [Bacteroidota bacterium]